MRRERIVNFRATSNPLRSSAGCGSCSKYVVRLGSGSMSKRIARAMINLSPKLGGHPTCKEHHEMSFRTV